jgi:RNA polymerase sigma factor (sigma-70 family)
MAECDSAFEFRHSIVTERIAKSGVFRKGRSALRPPFGVCCNELLCIRIDRGSARLGTTADAGLSSNQVDSDLKHLLLVGQEAALGTILRDYGPAVAAALRRRYSILNETDVEDVLATALYRLWAYRKRLDVSKGSGAKGSLAALFYRIADNVVRNLFKTGWHRLRLQEVRLEDWTEAMAAPARPAGTFRPDDAGPNDAAALGRQKAETGQGERIRQDLQSVIDSLPSAYRYIVLADATAKDRVASAELIAEELEIPAGTVRVYRNRAMIAIRGKLRALGYEVP